MQRRDLLKLALASPALAALGGCQTDETSDSSIARLKPGSAPYWGDIGSPDGPLLADDILYQVPDDQALNILVLGDSGSGNDNQWRAAWAIEAFKSRHPLDLVLHVGDVIYSHPDADPYHPSYDEKFGDIYGPYGIGLDQVPFYAWPGNHDRDTMDGLMGYARRKDTLLRMPANYYGINSHSDALYPGSAKPEVEIIGLDTNKLVKHDSFLDQLAYLDNRLGQSQAQYKLVVGHHPLLSNGKHGDSQQVADSLQILMEQHGVLAYLCGHEHDLELIRPVGGVHYMVSGGGGATLRDMDVRTNTRFAASCYGAFVIRLTRDSAHAIPLIADHESAPYQAYQLA